MKPFSYYWKYFIKPILSGVDPNSKEGLGLRIKKLEEGNKSNKTCALCGKSLGEGELNPHKECVDRESFLADRR